MVFPWHHFHGWRGFHLIIARWESKFRFSLGQHWHLEGKESLLLGRSGSSSPHCIHWHPHGEREAGCPQVASTGTVVRNQSPDFPLCLLWHLQVWRVGQLCHLVTAWQGWTSKLHSWPWPPTGRLGLPVSVEFGWSMVVTVWVFSVLLGWHFLVVWVQKAVWGFLFVFYLCFPIGTFRLLTSQALRVEYMRQNPSISPACHFPGSKFPNCTFLSLPFSVILRQCYI